MNKTIKTILLLIVAVIVVIAVLRIFGKEDTWICDNGTWIKHGNPKTEMPAESCY